MVHAVGRVLIVGVLISSVLISDGRTDTRKRDVHAGYTEHRTRHEVGAVDPAIGVVYFHRYVPESSEIPLISITSFQSTGKMHFEIKFIIINISVTQNICHKPLGHFSKDKFTKLSQFEMVSDPI